MHQKEPLGPALDPGGDLLFFVIWGRGFDFSVTCPLIFFHIHFLKKAVRPGFHGQVGQASMEEVGI